MSQRATQFTVVAAPPAVLFHVVTDFEHYLDWVSELKKIEVMARDDEGRATDVEFRAAAFGRSTTYVLHYDYSAAPGALTWHQSAGDLTSVLNGGYRFDEVEGGTRVTYELEVELLVPIPAFVRARAASRIQTQALRELKARAEGLT